MKKYYAVIEYIPIEITKEEYLKAIKKLQDATNGELNYEVTKYITFVKYNGKPILLEEDPPFDVIKKRG